MEESSKKEDAAHAPGATYQRPAAFLILCDRVRHMGEDFAASLGVPRLSRAGEAIGP